MKTQVTAGENLVVTQTIGSLKVKWEFPKPIPALKEAIELAQVSGRYVTPEGVVFDSTKDKNTFNWLAFYIMVYGKKPDNYKGIVKTVLKEIPISKWIYIPYLAQGLDDIAEVI